MLRITGGAWRGRTIKTPKGQLARPTLCRVREAIFSLLTGCLEDARVLDLFAGAGSLGFEALSRGAQRCVFVDRSRAHLTLIRQNAALLGCEGAISVRQAVLPRGLAGMADGQGAAPFDIVFLDAPYGEGLSGPTLDHLAQGPWLAPGALIVVETRKSEALPGPAGWELLKDRQYGDTRVMVFQGPGAGEASAPWVAPESPEGLAAP